MRHTALLLSTHSATFPDTLKTCLAILAAAKDMRLADSRPNTEDVLAGWPEHRADVVIMDIDLPGVSGLEAVRALAERHPAAQFLLYSMRDDDKRVFHALKAGANEYPVKSAKPLGLLTDAGLTEREQVILELLAEGLLYKEITSRVGISEALLKQHIHRMYGKLHVRNRTEAVNKYFGR